MVGGETKTLLLVDDEPAIRLTMSVLFEDAGFRVEIAASFAEAKEKLGEAGHCDVVLLDRNLGDGHGIDLVPLLREKRPGAKVVLVSGSTEGGPMSARGVDAVVAKGFFFPDLLARIEGLLAEGAP
jgi:two-component system OmpR family response regulator